MADRDILIDWFRVPNWVGYVSIKRDGTWRYHEKPVIYNEYTGEYESEGKHTDVACPPLLTKKGTLFTRHEAKKGEIDGNN